MGTSHSTTANTQPPGAYPLASSATPMSDPNSPNSPQSSTNQTAASPPAQTPGPAPAIPQIRLPSVPTAPGIFQRASSLFIPIKTPDVLHSHSGVTPTQIDLTTSLLISKGLPPELIPRILNYAEYWYTCTRECKRETRVVAGPHVPSPRLVRQSAARWVNGQEDELRDEMDRGLKDREGNVWFLASEEVGCVGGPEGVAEGMQGLRVAGTDDQSEGRDRKGKKVWVRSIKVKTLSKDQGWSTSNQQSYGTYNDSYTWFDLALLRNGEEVEDSRFDFQHNIHAGQFYKEHEHTFDSDSEFVKKIRPGDRIILWARAMYPGWQNHVREASISVTISPFPPDV